HGNSNSPKQYSFTDKNPVGGSNFSYRLKQIDTDGKFEYSEAVEVLLVPDEFFLSQNFPNPFNPSTTIEFSLSNTVYVTLEVFNTLGERVGVLASEEFSAGTYSYKWDASNLTSGIYFYILQAADFIQTRKMILLK
ncbi:MAG: T9SS type A sorting domain-containing protein, partial [Ignavibacteriaceae bacterium]|nr:T9SS type A sorting domain-containing protein [Ignavibacteriaceae bacterium]